MLKLDEIQALYEEVRPDVSDTFAYTGIQLNAILPALKRMDMFKDVEIEISNSPFDPGPDGNRDGRFSTVRLNNAFVPNKKIRLYSLMFAPGIFKENLQQLPHGVYILPAKTSEVDFKMKRSILTEIELERISDADIHGEVIIEPEGQILNSFVHDAVKVGALKQQLIQDFATKIDQIFAMSKQDFVNPSISDVQRFGQVYLRVSSDSYTIDGSENGMFDNNTYFKVIEPETALPF